MGSVIFCVHKENKILSVHKNSRIPYTNANFCVIPKNSRGQFKNMNFCVH